MLRNNRLAAVLAGLLMLVSAGAAAQDANRYVGQLLLEPTCPASWGVEADGRKLPIKANETLFSLFGTAYGGDGKNDFALPDLRGKASIAGYRYCVVRTGYFPARR